MFKRDRQLKEVSNHLNDLSNLILEMLYYNTYNIIIIVKRLQ